MLFVRLASQHFVSLRDEFERRIAAFDEKFLHPRIGVIEKEFARGGFAIASRAARFLIIRFDASRHIEVRHETDVRSIDPHAECIGRDDDVAPGLHELVLRLFALRVIHPAMVKNARNLRRLERFGDGFHSLSRRTINDAGLVLADQRVQALVLLRFASDVRDEQLQIRARESGDEFARLAQSKMSENIAPDFRRGRRREGRDLWAAQCFQHLIEPEIIRAKIMAPHREAMRFIDREKRDRALAERLQK